jgi:hypothetical protein
MSIFDRPEVKEFLAKLERQHTARQQRKLVDLDVVETSLVDRPAHLHDGWVVMKSAGHSHRPDAQYVEADEATTSTLLEAGFEKDTCGCAFLVTPESTAKAEREQFENHFKQLQKATANPPWDGMLTAEEVKFLMAGYLPDDEE